MDQGTTCSHDAVPGPTQQERQTPSRGFAGCATGRPAQPGPSSRALLRWEASLKTRLERCRRACFAPILHMVPLRPSIKGVRCVWVGEAERAVPLCPHQPSCVLPSWGSSEFALGCCGQRPAQPLAPPGSAGPPTTPAYTRCPSRPRGWGRHCSVPELGLGPCRCQWVWAWTPAWALPSWVRRSRSPRLAWRRVLWGPGMRPRCAACLPSPMRLCQRPRFCSRTALHGRPRTAARKQTSALYRAPGWEGALAVPLSCLALPPHVHEHEWPENTSLGCPDQLLPTLGTPVPPTPPPCFRAIPQGQDQAVQMEAAVMDGWPGPGRSPLRGGGELTRRGLAGQAGPALCRRIWLSQPSSLDNILAILQMRKPSPGWAWPSVPGKEQHAASHARHSGSCLPGSVGLLAPAVWLGRPRNAE